MAHILILSHDVIGTRMAGTGIRYWELAHALAATQPVVLLAPQPPDLVGLALPPMLTCAPTHGAMPPALRPTSRQQRS